MTEEELKIALEQNGSASAVLLKEAFDILNSKISGISAQDPRIVGAVSAYEPARLGKNVVIGDGLICGEYVSLGTNTTVGSDVEIGDGVQLSHSVEVDDFSDSSKRIALANPVGYPQAYLVSCYDSDNAYQAVPVSFFVSAEQQQIGVHVNGSTLGTISIDIV